MKNLKSNDVLLHTLTRVVTFIILAFSVYLFFAGHNNPGGGFIGGLMTASALLLMYLGFDMRSIKKAIPFDFTKMIAFGLLIAIFTGFGGLLVGDPYLTQYFEYYQIPILGETELTTALPFDLGIYLVVIGIALTIILTIAEDDM
ncbi:Mrp complex subunit B, sodium/proton antiporter subunit [Alkalihalophilus pseudofirmus OF4]|uniref:Na(+)/H(+) antiporter subunit B n=1 Tax=Alkalihalophilus pseudofirmus (strain ATCC BAA-2126 / JCM 17055 / OF4) TaxID=398511 RepID=MRPB_ALKPO|nr:MULTISPECIES: Na(+)/H(+) antiporter subunit B [Alkalihalophilus]Q9RGZ4.1 RecName: Full=Na(+)/H(+) antiporter subunit B; AltName: Full=Mrp complex subunit B; AltName: Full=Multiple resistance and pH homeostasis protein B [Alkalihalophilus pseudofirmus OF4]AAF21813.1 multiple resistance and pH regulation related protein B [Cytobacillus firmus]ADC50692.1 Mrp complex subunit B, sodium/proton antiporter subunit [Alkalihalophilus pseudofirmus OF4]MED1602556.1 Na(+)/H(+) antiporter subunit B [Alkal